MPDDASRSASGFLPGKHPIEAYGRGGFRFGGMSHQGSILALPSGIRSWDVTRQEDIDLAALASVFEEPEGTIEYLMIGMGETPRPLPRALRERCQAAGIKVEPMTTGSAANTYSLLLQEGRLVAAALLAVP